VKKIRSIPGGRGGELAPFEPGKRRVGRSAGVPNRTTRILKEAGILAAEIAGFPKLKPNNLFRGGLSRDFLILGWAKLNFGLAARGQNVMAITDAAIRFWQVMDAGPEHGSEMIRETVMNDFVTLGFVVLIIALVFALDSGLALIAIDRLAQSEGYTDIQNVMIYTDGPIRF
jgi:hypothetical protein